MKKLRLILGDQLNIKHSWFKDIDSDVTFLMMEIRQETDYVKHHIQKIIAFFLAMRSFAKILEQEGHRVIYLHLDNPSNKQSLDKNIEWIVSKYKFDKFEYLYPDEYRLDLQLKSLSEQLAIPCGSFDTEHFLTDRLYLRSFFRGKKQMLMESFYRHMRRKYDILMDGKEPIGGKWNYDKENRKKLPSGHQLPGPLLLHQDVSQLVQMIRKAKIEFIGEVDEKDFEWPVTRKSSLQLLDYFGENLLGNFGTYQDAMTAESWSMYHARLSFSLNSKLLHPLEVIQKIIAVWNENSKNINLAQVEGFVRQILGWREFMRGIYWDQMPEYETLNYFGHGNPLPDFYWTANTKMNCMQHAISQSLKHAYAHHIQRLMITGNFALLAGVDPDELDKWYLGIYIDAIQWVEITNTRGMSQFADGGIVGTKPYVSSANYIDKMSDYCSSCHYNPRKKTGTDACPFNSLYWHFYNRNRNKLADNPRIGMMYRTWDKMKSADRKAILQQAEDLLKNINDI